MVRRHCASENLATRLDKCVEIDNFLLNLDLQELLCELILVIPFLLPDRLLRPNPDRVLSPGVLGDTLKSLWRFLCHRYLLRPVSLARIPTVPQEPQAIPIFAVQLSGRRCLCRTIHRWHPACDRVLTRRGDLRHQHTDPELRNFNRVSASSKLFFCFRSCVGLQEKKY